MSTYETLLAKIENKTAKLGVVGLGYVGLPLIRAFANVGFSTIGYDVDQKKVDKLQKGESYIAHIPTEWIKDWLASKTFEPTSDMKRLSEADAILICVPTPLNDSRDPDVSYIESTGRYIAAVLRPGQLIVLESTTYPGTTRDVLLPILEKSGLKAGVDFFVAYSPEREDPGNPNYTASGIPKVVGGLDANSLELAHKLYSFAVVKTVPVSSCEVAEATKILENTYRAVNIALVNELKILFDKMGLDVWEVIDAAKTKPFGYQAFYPGPGLGGHCIPIDPFYLSWLARKVGLTTRFIEVAGEINTHMPHYVVEKIGDALNDIGKPIKGSKICILGMAYKRDVDDPRESPSFELYELLSARGAVLTYSDPHIPVMPRMRHHEVPDLKSQDLTPAFLASQDVLLIATDHTAFDYAAIVKHGRLVVDTRNATKNVKEGREKIRKA
jgi:UDP-N-acetyl-D-glucosamine dehydrogenase